MQGPSRPSRGEGRRACGRGAALPWAAGREAGFGGGVQRRLWTRRALTTPAPGGQIKPASLHCIPGGRPALARGPPRRIKSRPKLQGRHDGDDWRGRGPSDVRGVRRRDHAHPPGAQRGPDVRDHGQAEARRLQGPRGPEGQPDPRTGGADREAPRDGLKPSGRAGTKTERLSPVRGSLGRGVARLAAERVHWMGLALRVALFCGTALLGAAALGAPSQGATFVVSGNLPADTAWTLSGSPYTLEGDVRVPPGIHLEIDAGVTGYAPFAGRIIVEGDLGVRGASGNGVTLAPGPSEGSWGGIPVNARGRATIANATITRPDTGVAVNTTGFVLITDTLIQRVLDEGVSVVGDSGGVVLRDVTLQQ